MVPGSAGGIALEEEIPVGARNCGTELRIEAEVPADPDIGGLVMEVVVNVVVFEQHEERSVVKHVGVVHDDVVLNDVWNRIAVDDTYPRAVDAPVA
jgi:hypothetical protein